MIQNQNMKTFIRIRGPAFALFILCMLSLLTGPVVMAEHKGDNPFPLRIEYPGLSPITSEELNNILADTVIIDARSQLEFNVIHIKGAFNISVGKMTENDLLQLRSKDGSKPMVFYCNGHTCPKSYKAAQRAGEFGFLNIRVYDAGIFTWANAFPEQTVLFNELLSRETVGRKIIADSEFSKVNIPTNEFLEKFRSGDYTIIDIRDIDERKENPVKLPGVRQLHLNLIEDFLKNSSGPVPENNLLFFDNVGKQTRWLQYYLEKYGRKNYFFLKGGVRQWHKDGFSPEGVRQ